MPPCSAGGTRSNGSSQPARRSPLGAVSEPGWPRGPVRDFREIVHRPEGLETISRESCHAIRIRVRDPSRTGLDEVVSTAASIGYDCVEVMCWPTGKADRRYAGVTHIDVCALTDEEVARIHGC